MLARSSGIVKVGGCVYQEKEVFKKQLQGFEILNKKQLDFICPGLDLYHELFLDHQSSKRL